MTSDDRCRRVCACCGTVLHEKKKFASIFIHNFSTTGCKKQTVSNLCEKHYIEVETWIQKKKSTC